MKDKQVKEVMIPLSDYATVSEEETLVNAIKELQQSRNNTQLNHKHRAVLVYGKDNQITGKLSIRCILKALEPKYRQFEHPESIGNIGLSRFGFNNDFLKSLLDNFNLWDETLEELVKKASKLKVKNVMYTPSSGEYVDENAPISEAVHQFILGCHQSLLVLKEDKVVGIIRLPDIFDLVCEILV
ncbi:CBS domain-containing protein [Desulfobacula toluolica]|uniref:CBS domain protein n=1 Tax=Desulfobacula toluolica (strain DSM 7467 / Tol2) TaxID=651182 RepID=K0NN41_DESTT|nr:CBS domain-containing protein [Desulfobacula toluolica]CCK80107.1 CBS domain protein [Desulfobacula toluolica Tol2]